MSDNARDIICRLREDLQLPQLKVIWVSHFCFDLVISALFYLNMLGVFTSVDFSGAKKTRKSKWLRSTDYGDMRLIVIPLNVFLYRYFIVYRIYTS